VHDSHDPRRRQGLLGLRPEAHEPIRIGFQVWGQSVAWADLMAAGERIEALGFASLFTNDHFMPVLGGPDGWVVGPPGPVFEAWMTLAGWAARTRRIPLGVLVCGVGYRNVGLTVKMATALDHASGGRTILGLGAGWHEPEQRAFGFDALTLGERIGRLDETARVSRGLLDGETVAFNGRWVTTLDLRNDPPPVQDRLPLLIGGSGEQRTLRIVARDADIWNGEGDPATFARKNAILDAHCAEIGRDPWTIRRTVGVPPICIRNSRAGAVEALRAILARQGGDPALARGWAESSPLADTEEVVAGLLRSWRAAGVEEAIVDLPSPADDETLERLSGSVLPRLA
jgi:alkanesulfonate monooxygenase SsuD/methylene tetrahydromethanopterin reductase-like flavin-dependent oxidoreductase (luciferase family)